jgi:hypothetical protein
MIEPTTFVYPRLTEGSGKTLTIEALGTVQEDIEEGAYVVLQVKYGLIRLVNTKADLCEQVKNVDMECPIKKGKTKIIKDVDLPNEIPPVSRPDLAVKGISLLICVLGKIHCPR